MINLTLFYCWHRYSNMGCVFRPSNYNWINTKEPTILLIAVAIFIVCLPILYLWFDQFHLQNFDCCVQCSTCWIVQRDILYYKYNHKFPTYNIMTETLELFLSVLLFLFSFRHIFPIFSLRVVLYLLVFI